MSSASGFTDNETKVTSKHQASSHISKSAQLHLGSDILGIERELKEYFSNRIPLDSTNTNQIGACCHIPRSIFSGAEKFIEACELLDILQIGALDEEGIA